MLSGLDQNGKGYGCDAHNSSHVICDSPGGETDANPLCNIRGIRVSPIVSISVWGWQQPPATRYRVNGRRIPRRLLARQVS